MTMTKAFRQQVHFITVTQLLLLQVPPAELESIILTHPGVADAAVIGLPDTEAGKLPKAYVIKKPRSHLVEEDITKYVAGGYTLWINF